MIKTNNNFYHNKIRNQNKLLDKMLKNQHSDSHSPPSYGSTIYTSEIDNENNQQKNLNNWNAKKKIIIQWINKKSNNLKNKYKTKDYIATLKGLCPIQHIRKVPVSIRNRLG